MFNQILKYGEAEVVYKNIKKLAKKPILHNLFWETTLRCNALCKHCGSRAGENINIEDELTTEEIKRALKSIADKYDSTRILLNVTGGEPLVRQDLFDVMKYATELGFKWGITTNGMLINDEIIKKMKETNLATMSISIDGLEKSHDEFRGIKGSYRKILENIEKLKQDKFLKCFQITTVVNKLNINELDELYKIIKNLEVDSWRVINMDPIGRANDNNNLALDKDDYKYLFEFIKSKRKESNFDVTYGCAHFVGMTLEKELRDNIFFCSAGYTTASILYNGDIYVCPNVERRKELIQGNVKKDDFMDVWNNKFKWFRDIDKLKSEQCKNCEDWKYCRGDSLHTWNFKENKPNMCLKKINK